MIQTQSTGDCIAVFYNENNFLNARSQQVSKVNSDLNGLLICWWRIRDLNPGPTDYDSAALTTELIRHVLNYKRPHCAFGGMACQDES